MRSAEFRPLPFALSLSKCLPRSSAMLSAAALCIAVTGCASVTEPIKAAASSVTSAVKDVVKPSSVVADVPAAATAASSPVAVATKPLEPEQPGSAIRFCGRLELGARHHPCRTTAVSSLLRGS